MSDPVRLLTRAAGAAYRVGLTGWNRARRRAWRGVRRRPRAAAFAALLAAGLAWAAWPHLGAAAAGHLAAWRGHYVEWGYYIPEERRRLAPLPTRSKLWRTPVAVGINAPFPFDGPPAGGPEPLSAALDRVARMPWVKYLSVSYATVSVEDARRFAATHRGDELGLHHCRPAPGALRTLAGRGGWVRLHLNGSTLPPGGLAAFAGRDELRSIWLADADGAGGQFAAFAGHPGLSWVEAPRAGLTDEDLSALARCPNLRHLSADDAPVTDAGVAALLRRAEQLSDVSLARTVVTDAAFVDLPGRPRLTDLRLAGTGVTDATVRLLAGRCPNLCRLDLSHTAVTDAALPHLARLTDLTRLDLTETGVTAAALQGEIPWPALEGLSVSARVVPPPAALRGWDRFAEGGPKVTFAPPR